MCLKNLYFEIVFINYFRAPTKNMLYIHVIYRFEVKFINLYDFPIFNNDIFGSKNKPVCTLIMAVQLISLGFLDSLKHI